VAESIPIVPASLPIYLSATKQTDAQVLEKLQQLIQQEGTTTIDTELYTQSSNTLQVTSKEKLIAPFLGSHKDATADATASVGVQYIYHPTSSILHSKDSMHLLQVSLAKRLVNSLEGASGAEEVKEARENAIDVKRENSDFLRRVGKTGNLGPMAYHGRHDSSLLMTRSIGDRMGPRGCLAVADVTAVTIGAEEHAR
jgi:hypothetical protein